MSNYDLSRGLCSSVIGLAAIFFTVKSKTSDKEQADEILEACLTGINDQDFLDCVDMLLVKFEEAEQELKDILLQKKSESSFEKIEMHLQLP